MENWQKLLIAGGGALLVGFLVGYLLGAAGEGAAEERAEKAERRLSTVESSVKGELESCESARSRVRRKVTLLRAKEQLLRAHLQVVQHNFGTAARHLGAARGRLRSARKGAKSKTRRRIDKILKELSGAHTIAMKLDPMAAVQVERLVEMVHRLRGAR